MDAIRLQADYQFAQMRHNANPTAETAEKLDQAKEAYDRALNAETADKIGAELFSPEDEGKLEDTDKNAGAEAEDEQAEQDEQGSDEQEVETKTASKKKRK
jgi:hypothetical protein